MLRKFLFPIILIIAFGSSSKAQDEDLLLVSTIPAELKVKSNAVVRYDDIDIDIKAYNKLIFTNKRIVTIFNDQGDSKQGGTLFYDKNKTIKKLEARIYDAFGKEIKKIKKNDFQDVSAVSGSTLYSDSRIKYLNYTPIKYPYTIVLDIEVEYSSTAFLPGWRPIEGYYVSTQNADYEIINSSDVKVKIKTTNFEDYNIEKLSDYHYSAKNLKSIKPESYSPSFSVFAPFLRAALTEFDMEGVKGVNNDWNDFGKWMHDKLLVGTEKLPENAKLEIKALTEGITDDIEKAKIVYNYMQEKTRYISVQIGIGGWKPMIASDVDRLGYADCKGLSNYTKALLNEVGVEAYYAVIYGDRGIINIDKEFSATEGNHVVLCIPREEDDIWLECTSQTNPFGYIASWTDDRDALLITPEGGKIVHTTAYKTEDNIQTTKSVVILAADGSIQGKVDIETKGYQYALHEGTQNESVKNQNLHFKEYWDYINNLTINEIKFNNNKDSIVFDEHIELSVKNYAIKSGNRLLFQPNMFNRVTYIPTRYKKRTHDFEIVRGYTDVDEFSIEFDPNLEVEAMPKPVSISNKFGSYTFITEKISDNQLIYKRTYILNKAYYAKEDYDEFRAFCASIVKYDKSKIVFISKL